MTEFIDYKEVLSTLNPGDIAIIKSVLDSEGITYFFQGENFTYWGRGVIPARLMVKKDEVEKAREILKDLKLNFNVINLREDSEEK